MKKQKLLEIVKFCVSGAISLGVYYIVLYTLTEFVKVWYPISALISSTLTYSISFIFQKYWTFKNKDKKMIPKQITFYFILSASLTGSNSLLLYILVEYLNLHYLVAQIFLTGILSVVSFILTKKIFTKNSVSS